MLQDNCSNTIEVVAFNDYVQKSGSFSVKKSFSEFFKIDLNSEEANNKRIKELNKWWYSAGKNLEDNKSLSINSQLQKRKFIDENGSTGTNGCKKFKYK